MYQKSLEERRLAQSFDPIGVRRLALEASLVRGTLSSEFSILLVGKRLIHFIRYRMGTRDGTLAPIDGSPNLASVIKVPA